MSGQDPFETITPTVPASGASPLFGDESRDPEAVVMRLMHAAANGEEALRALSGYVLDKELGRGGMGAVFLIRRPGAGQEAACAAALKVMLPGVSASERLRGKFLREIAVAKAFDHPHLVTLLHSGAWQNIFWYTMPYYPGGNVSQLVQKRGGKVPASEACALILQVLDGLDCFHQTKLPSCEVEANTPDEEAGAVHRDIKPENILLDGDEGSYTAKLADYGLAKFRALAGHSGLTSDGEIGGTWRCMCRQQLGDFKYAGPDVDVWSTAACLYFMVTGSFPRHFAKGERRPWKVIEQNQPVPVRQRGIQIPDELADLLDLVLDDRAQLRFQSAKAFKEALLTCIRESVDAGEIKGDADHFESF